MLDGISNKFSDLIRRISGKASISEKNVQDAVEEIKVALLDADVNLRVVRRFINSTLEEAVGEKVLRSVNPGQQFTKIVYDKMVSFLGDQKQDLQLKGPDTLSPILMLGLQGSGKTTASAKLAYKLKKEGRKVLLVAADLVRPAAVEQLKVLGSQIEVEVYSEDSKNPVAVVKNALNYAHKNQFNVLIADTSGRLHLDDSMMQELEDIKKVLDPVDALLVADAMTGQHAVDIAKEFNERTAKQAGLIIPVVITVYQDRSFTFITKTPPASVLIKKACGIESGSGVPNKTKVANITKAQVREIAEMKMPDLNAASVEAAMSMVAGTARSMGVVVVD